MFLRSTDQYEIDKFLKDHHREMKLPEFYFGEDTNQSRRTDWESSSIRILVAFLSDGKTRSVSSTYAALDYLAKLETKSAFVDYSYRPLPEDAEMLRRNHIPLVFGNVSHRPWWEYDLLCVSCSVLSEVLYLPYMMNKSGIPLGFKARMKERIPLIMYGGAAAAATTIIHGYVDRDRTDKGLVDFCQIGYGEGVFNKLMPLIENFLIERRARGFEVRQDLYEFLKHSDVVNQTIPKKLYFPYHYEYIYFNDNTILIDRIECTDPELALVGEVDIHKPDENFPVFDKKIINLDGGNSRSVDVMIASGCSAGCCSFCSEGHLAGGWREKPFSEVAKNMESLKATSAANTVGFYAYNLNYYGRFVDLLKAGADSFSNMSLINQRMDVLGSREDYAVLQSKLGIVRMSVAVEGIGNKIRNKFLNKNLSREFWIQAMRNVFKQKLLTVKFTLILTGKETEEDWEDFYSELEEVQRVKRECGAGTALSITITPLIIYDTTPLRYEEREGAKASYFNIRGLQEQIQKIQALGYRIKFHGTPGSIYFEQALTDFGPRGTSFLVDFSLNSGMVDNRVIFTPKLDVLKEFITKHGIDPVELFQKRDPKRPLPVDVFNITTPKIIEEWKEMFRKQDYSKEICLVTPAHLKGHCTSCGLCKTTKQVTDTISRTLESEHSVDEVISSLSSSRAVSSVRFLLRKKASKVERGVYNPVALTHAAISKVLQLSSKYNKAFYRIQSHPFTRCVNQDTPSWFGGAWFADVEFRTNITVDQLLEDKVIEKVNKQLTSVEITNILPSHESLYFTKGDTMNWVGFLPDTSFYTLKQALLTWDYMVYAFGKKVKFGYEIEKRQVLELEKRVLFEPYHNGILIGFSLPFDFNPYLVLAGLLEQSWEKVMQVSTFNLIGVYRDIAYKCACGNDASFDLMQLKNLKYCPVCALKGALSLIKRGK